ncbi:unnamed protein product [Mytilus coruscus]|uniref:Uncharacterized protein n=1 Tax=Mytilus coruscus TaxID=42192 RepID=A0A6J8AF21_MYTCO|nr:unnamed protein product [Mytilus coruscus]
MPGEGVRVLHRRRCKSLPALPIYFGKTSFTSSKGLYVGVIGMTQRKRLRRKASATRRPLQYIMKIDGETLEEFAEQVHLLTKDMTLYFRSNDDTIDQIDTEAILRGCQEDVAQIVIEKNHRTINEALKWITSSLLANQKASYGASRSYSGSPQSYSQRQVTFSDMNDSDPSPQRLTALQNSQRVEKVDNSLQPDIIDLVSLVGQDFGDGSTAKRSLEMIFHHDLADMKFYRYYFEGTIKELTAWQHLSSIIFGVSGKFIRDNTGSEIIHRIPPQQLVLETDSHFISPFACCPVNHPWNLTVIATEILKPRESC